MPNNNIRAFRPAMRDAVLKSLAAGSTYRDACAVAGIPWVNWCYWYRLVRDGKCNDPDVTDMIIKARATYAQATNEIGRAHV